MLHGRSSGVDVLRDVDVRGPGAADGQRAVLLGGVRVREGAGGEAWGNGGFDPRDTRVDRKGRPIEG